MQTSQMRLAKKYSNKHLVIHFKHQKTKQQIQIDKEENQIIVNNINKNEEKIGEECETSYGLDWLIQPNSQRIDLIDANQLILNFNETIQLDLV